MTSIHRWILGVGIAAILMSASWAVAQGEVAPSHPEGDAPAEEHPVADPHAAAGHEAATHEAAGQEGAHGEAHGAHGGFPLGQVVASVVNFVLYVALLVWLAKKAVTNFYRKRTEELNEAVTKAKATLTEADRLHQEAAARLAHAQEEADRIVQNAKDAAGRQGHDIIVAAKTKSERMLADAQATIDAETAKLMADVRDMMSFRVVEAAKARLATEADASVQRRLVNDYIQRVEEA
ncbi:MAG: hypothetical protein IT350_10525 [Deltaproteobacteria bacterium]|nr:hypothetical protein [Deltaproteobacteria bacterium]